MQLLPDREQAKPFAIALALLAVVLVYLVGFHWFFMRHVELSGQISQVKDDIASFSARANQRTDIEERLREIRIQRDSNDLFLGGTNFDTAAAELTQRLKQIIATQADHENACQVISNRNVRPRETERFEKVLVEIRMRCNLADFVKVVYELETSAPLVFIDGMNIYQRYVTAPDQSNSRSRRRNQQNPAELDIRFEMYGYLGVEQAVAAQQVAGVQR